MFVSQSLKYWWMFRYIPRLIIEAGPSLKSIVTVLQLWVGYQSGFCRYLWVNRLALVEDVRQDEGF